MFSELSILSDQELLSKIKSSHSISLPRELGISFFKEKGALISFLANNETAKSNLLTEFQDYLGSFKLNTQKAYLTDVSLFLVRSLFSFWKYPIKFSFIAEHVLLIHILKRLDSLYQEGNLNQDELQSGFNYIYSIYLNLKGRSLENNSVFRILGTKDFLGENAYIQFSADELDMSLGEEKNECKFSSELNKVDKSILTFLFNQTEKLMDHEFWDICLQSNRIGQVLNYQEQHRKINQNTRTRRLASLRAFEIFLYSRRLITSPTMCFIKRPREVRNPQIFLKKVELMRLYDQVDKEFVLAKEGRISRNADLILRDKAMLAVLACTFSRNDEICKLSLRDLDLKNKTIFINKKGGKSVVAPILSFAVDLIREWLKVRPRILNLSKNKKAKESENLFLSIRGTKVTPKSFHRIINEYALRAGIIKNINGRTGIGPHVLRRSWPAILHNNGASLIELSKILGHSSIVTTEKCYLADWSVDLESTLINFHPNSSKLEKKKKKKK